MINSKPNFEIQPRRHDFLLYSGKNLLSVFLPSQWLIFRKKWISACGGEIKFWGRIVWNDFIWRYIYFGKRFFPFCVSLSGNMNHYLRILVCEKYKKALKVLLLNADFARLFTNECRTTELMLSTIPQYFNILLFSQCHCLFSLCKVDTEWFVWRKFRCH